jgi:hypothetical protein
MPANTILLLKKKLTAGSFSTPSTTAMPRASVEITAEGRGGSVDYREGELRIAFSWEFAEAPAIALVFGPRAAAWNRSYPWAADRQAEIYRFVGAEVVRQRAAGYAFDVDLDRGIIEVRTRQSSGERQTPAPPRRSAGGAPVPRPLSVEAIEALGEIDTPEVRDALQEALRDHLSIDLRLVAAEALYRRDPSFDLEAVLARQLRALDRPSNGLQRALRLAERLPSEVTRQALLWAGWNQTECAPACAALLLRLSGATDETTNQQILDGLGLRTGYFMRKAAFEELCKRVDMVLDTSVDY